MKGENKMSKSFKSLANKISEIWNNNSTGEAIFIIVTGTVVAVAIEFGRRCLQAWLVMLLWNWVAVGLFGAPVLSFWIAFGLRWLCGLLFKSKSNNNEEEK